MTTQTRSRFAAAFSLILLLQPTGALATSNPSAPASTPATEELLLVQRRGGGSRGGGSRGGRSSSRGSRSGSRSSGGRTGFSSYSGNRQSSRQTTRSTRQTTRSGSRDQRQTNRMDSQRRDSHRMENNRMENRGTRQNTRNTNIDTRQQGRTDRTNDRQSNRNDRVNTRSKTRRDAINNWDRYGNGWYSGSSWYRNRPWNNGWYGSSYYNNWRWYPGQAAAWGIASMASFSVINSLVQTAQNNEVSYITVPDSNYSLYYPSVTASGDVVTFEADNGYETVRFSADCRDGTLDGGAPRNANEAQLLNASCQVAFGQ